MPVMLEERVLRVLYSLIDRPAKDGLGPIAEIHDWERAKSIVASALTSAESDRDAGWQAADALARYAAKYLRSSSGEHRTGCSELAGSPICTCGLGPLTEALAAYTAARAARNPNPEGRT